MGLSKRWKVGEIKGSVLEKGYEKRERSKEERRK
jgi:hypothetical protein